MKIDPASFQKKDTDAVSELFPDQNGRTQAAMTEIRVFGPGPKRKPTEANAPVGFRRFGIDTGRMPVIYFELAEHIISVRLYGNM